MDMHDLRRGWDASSILDLQILWDYEDAELSRLSLLPFLRDFPVYTTIWNGLTVMCCNHRQGNNI